MDCKPHGATQKQNYIVSDGPSQKSNLLYWNKFSQEWSLWKRTLRHVLTAHPNKKPTANRNKPCDWQGTSLKIKERNIFILWNIFIYQYSKQFWIQSALKMAMARVLQENALCTKWMVQVQIQVHLPYQICCKISMCKWRIEVLICWAKITHLKIQNSKTIHSENLIQDETLAKLQTQREST